MEERSVELQQKIKEVCDRMRNLGFGGFICNIGDAKIIEKYGSAFCNVFNIRMPFRSIWYCCDDNAVYCKIQVSFFDAGRSISDVDYKTDPFDTRESGSHRRYTMSNSQLAKVLDILNAICKDREDEIAKTIANKPIEDLYDDIERIAKNYINSKYEVSFEVGKRNLDSNPYKCLVVREKGNYIGSIVFNRNKFGEYTMCTRLPLCGEHSMAFSADNLEKTLEKELEFIVS